VIALAKISARPDAVSPAHPLWHEINNHSRRARGIARKARRRSQRAGFRPKMF